MRRARTAFAAVAVAALGIAAAPALGTPKVGAPLVAVPTWSLVHDAAGEAVHSVVVAGPALLGGTRWEGLLRVEGAAATRPLSSPVAALARSPADPPVLLAGTWAEGVFASADGGLTWTPDATGLEAVDTYSFVFVGDEGFAGTSAGVFRRGAAGWEPRSAGLGARNVFSLAAVDGRLYAGTEHGVFTSDDAGLTWQARSAGLGEGPARAFVRSGSVVLAGTDRGLYRTTDGGATWSAVTGGPSGPVRALAAAVRAPEVVFAGGRDGVFVSRDGGATWRAIGDGLTGESLKVLSLAVGGTCPETVYAGTGSGLWQLLQECGGPAAVDDVAVTPQYEAVTIPVLANDTDPDGEDLSVVAVTQPAHGRVTVNADGTVTYTPNHTFKEQDSFTYTMSDGDDPDTAAVTVLELGCGEDGLDSLDGTAAEGAASGTIDRRIEPLVGGFDPSAAKSLHDANCDLVVPAENAVDEIIP